MQSKKKETVVQICRGKCPHYLGKKSVFVLARPIPRVAKPTLIRCHSSLSDFLDLQRFTIYIYQQVLQPSLLSLLDIIDFLVAREEKKGKGPPTPPQLGIRKVFLDVLNTGLGISLHLGLIEYTRLA